MTTAEVIARLADREVVDGVITLGSVSSGKLGRASDYDLVVVVSETPAPIRTGLTWIDRHLNDLLFVTVDEVDQVLAGEGPL